MPLVILVAPLFCLSLSFSGCAATSVVLQAAFIEVLQTSLSQSHLAPSTMTAAAFMCFLHACTQNQTYTQTRALAADPFCRSAVEAWQAVDVKLQRQACREEVATYSERTLYLSHCFVCSQVRHPLISQSFCKTVQHTSPKPVAWGGARFCICIEQPPCSSMQTHARILPVVTCLVLPGPAL